MPIRHCTILAAALLLAGAALSAKEKAMKFITLDPGHFHAALVQKSMYPQVDPVVHLYASDGPDLDLHLERIEAFNTRADDPTHWQTEKYAGPDFLKRMLAERLGNVVVLAGNNARKTEYILRCVDAGLHVLADKPMAITPQDLPLLEKAFAVAGEKDLIVYDIMTERHEITNVLQRALSRNAALFGEKTTGSVEEPAVTKESVHHFYKQVSGKPLIRPPWFFDVAQEGEGMVDVGTHLVDLIQWELFPDTALAPSDVTVLSARRWATVLTPAEFERATGLRKFPDYLTSSVNADGDLEVYANGELTYTLRGVVCKVSVIWNYEAPPGTGDTHHSIMRGSKTALVIRQGAEQGYKPTLYIEPISLTGAALARETEAAVSRLQSKFPGVAAQPSGDGFEVVIADKYKVGHEAHFAQVTEDFLEYLSVGKLPDWEVPNMLVKHHTLMRAYEMSR